LGAMLARAEGEILFTELATRIDELVLDEDTLRYKDYFVLRGLDVLPVTFKSSR
jgi:cytochrome P450